MRVTKHTKRMELPIAKAASSRITQRWNHASFAADLFESILQQLDFTIEQSVSVKGELTAEPCVYRVSYFYSLILKSWKARYSHMFDSFVQQRELFSASKPVTASVDLPYQLSTEQYTKLIFRTYMCSTWGKQALFKNTPKWKRIDKTKTAPPPRAT